VRAVANALRTHHSCCAARCASAGGAGFSEEESIGLLSDLPAHLQREHGYTAAAAEAALARVTASLRELTAELFRAFRGEFAVFAPLPHCFEHFGLDFMLDAALNVWLLEVSE
jgi:tubulin---tyrosine ligase